MIWLYSYKYKNIGYEIINKAKRFIKLVKYTNTYKIKAFPFPSYNQQRLKWKNKILFIMSVENINYLGIYLIRKIYINRNIVESYHMPVDHTWILNWTYSMLHILHFFKLCLFHASPILGVQLLRNSNLFQYWRKSWLCWIYCKMLHLYTGFQVAI